ncbi:MAG: heavy-metal-associated domain-containing protein [Flavobacteriaceae bacterium]
MKKFIVLILLFAGGLAQAQNKNAKATIEVDGVCGMCKMRIEKAALKTKGVKSAVWNIENHQLSLIYNEEKTNLETIQQNISNVGHDTKAFKASDEAYNKLDACCKYRDPNVIDSHGKDGSEN